MGNPLLDGSAESHCQARTRSTSFGSHPPDSLTNEARGHASDVCGWANVSARRRALIQPLMQQVGTGSGVQDRSPRAHWLQSSCCHPPVLANSHLAVPIGVQGLTLEHSQLEHHDRAARPDEGRHGWRNCWGNASAAGKLAWTQRLDRQTTSRAVLVVVVRWNEEMDERYSVGAVGQTLDTEVSGSSNVMRAVIRAWNGMLPKAVEACTC